MKKPIIAVDIDDVLADSTEALRQVVNRRLGTNLEISHYKIPGQYWGYYEMVWKANGLDHLITMDEIGPRMHQDQSHVKLKSGAKLVLEQLSRQYDLVIVSARSLEWYDATLVWLNDNIPSVFKEVVFADGYEGLRQKHKGTICREIGASWLIDDNIDHAQAALDEGLSAILFGDYGWQQGDTPEQVVRCKTWSEVGEYFATRG